MSQQIANQDPALLYQAPMVLDQQSRNFVKFKPTRNTFSNGETISVRLESNTEYFDPQRSFIEFKMTPTETPDTGKYTTMTNLGGASVISSVTEYVAGSALTPVNKLGLIYYSDFTTDNPARKKMLYKTSGFVPQDGLETYTAWASLASTAMGTQKFAIPLCGHLKTASTPIPLPDLAGGIEYVFTLTNNLYDVFLKADNTHVFPSAYTITDFAIVGNMLRPSDQYLMEHQSALAQGASLDIPLEIPVPQTFTITSSTTQQTVNINTGNRKSLNSVLIDVRSVDATDDPFNAQNELASYCTNLSFLIGSERFPKNYDLNLTSPSSSYECMALTSVNDQVSNYSDIYTTSGFFIQNFKSSHVGFGSGVPCEHDIQVNVTMSADKSACTCTAVLFFDAILKITNSYAKLLA